MGTVLVVFGILAVIGYFFGKKEETQKKNGSPVPAPDKPAQFSKSDDPFIAELQSVKKNAAAELTQTVGNLKAELAQKFQEDIALKAKLTSFAKANELDKAVIAVWDEIKYYPSRNSKGDTENRLNMKELVEVKSEEKKPKIQQRQIQFTYGNEKYNLRTTEEDHQGFAGDDYTTCLFELFENEKLVFGVDCRVSIGEWVTSMSAKDFTCVIKAGNWAKMLVEAHYKLQTETAKYQEKNRFYGADKIKGNFEE